MGRITALSLSLLTLLFFTLGVGLTPVIVEAPDGFPVHNLDTLLNYASIQEAINANETLDGHTLLVSAGTYYEQIVINKSLTLLGQNRSLTILEGSSKPNVVTVIADNVTIQEFTIQNAGGGDLYDGGIHVTSDNNRISHNTIINNSLHGISIEKSKNTYIYKNWISRNQYSGILATNTSGIKVESNNFSNSFMAIYFIACNDSIVSSNTAFNNTSGAFLDGGHSNLVYNNSITMSPATIFPSGAGIYLGDCFNCTAIRNRVSNHSMGAGLGYSYNNTVMKNNFFNNTRGIVLVSEANNTISENTFTTNDLALYSMLSSRNTQIFHNNFLRNNNISQLDDYNSKFDNGFEGNYWDNYNGVDLNHDGIGDTPYLLEGGYYSDPFPLMGTFSSFNTTSEHDVYTICNSTISEFQYNGTAISFNVTGENGSAGFCRVYIPTALMSEYRILVNKTEVSYDLLPVSNSTHSYLYFTYDHSTKEVVIIPEYPSPIIFSSIMIATLLAVFVYKRKTPKSERASPPK